MGYFRTSLVIFKIDKSLAYLGLCGEFEYGLHADQCGSPQHRQRSGLPWSVR